MPPGDGADGDGDGRVVAQVKAALPAVGLRVALLAKAGAVVPLTALLASGGLAAGVEALATHQRCSNLCR